MTDPVFSTRDAITVEPEGSGRVYVIAPLSFRQRAAYQADLARFGGVYPGQVQMMEALRAAVIAMAPANQDALLEMMARADLDPTDAEARRAVQVIEATCASVPAYAELLAARTHYMSALPFVAARHALRDWSGPGLPAFSRVRDVVPADLLDQVPPDDIELVGWRAAALMRPDQSAEGNSASPSLSPMIPAPAMEETSPPTAGDGYSPGANGM